MGYTWSRRPVVLVWSEHFDQITDAIAVERQIKGWGRAKREALIRRDWASLQKLAERRAGRPSLPVILRCEPRSAFTRVFDALWGEPRRMTAPMCTGSGPSPFEGRASRGHLRVTGEDLGCGTSIGVLSPSSGKNGKGETQTISQTLHRELKRMPLEFGVFDHVDRNNLRSPISTKTG